MYFGKVFACLKGNLPDYSLIEFWLIFLLSFALPGKLLNSERKRSDEAIHYNFEWDHLCKSSRAAQKRDVNTRTNELAFDCVSDYFPRSQFGLMCTQRVIFFAAVDSIKMYSMLMSRWVVESTTQNQCRRCRPSFVYIKLWVVFAMAAEEKDKCKVLKFSFSFCPNEILTAISVCTIRRLFLSFFFFVMLNAHSFNVVSLIWHRYIVTTRSTCSYLYRMLNQTPIKYQYKCKSIDINCLSCSRLYNRPLSCLCTTQFFTLTRLWFARRGIHRFQYILISNRILSGDGRGSHRLKGMLCLKFGGKQSKQNQEANNALNASNARRY